MDFKRVKISDLQQGPIRHYVLSKDLLERIKAYKEVLAEVEKTSLASTIDNFQRDLDPEHEIATWERIANIYKLFLSHNPTDEVAIKKDIFSVILGVSMGMNDWSKIKYLTQDQINHLVLNCKGL